MQEQELGASGVKVSRVVFGAMAFSAKADAERRIETIRAAVEIGMSIDTAPLYDFGRSEELIGRAIADLRGRARVLTKVGLRWDDPRGQVLFRFRDEHGREQAVRKNSRPESITLEVDRSLSRLGVEVVDLVQVHHPDPDTPIAETMGALAELLQRGKLRAIGVSNYDADQMRQAQAALGTIPLASNQVRYSLLDRSPEVGVLPLARAQRIGVLAYSPLEQGLLTGGFRSDALANDDGRRNHPLFHPQNVARVATALHGALAPLAEARGASVAQVALAWLLAQPGLSAVIAGASSIEQLRRNAGACQLSLRSDELFAIRQAFAAVRLDMGAGGVSPPAPRAALGASRANCSAGSASVN